VPPTSAGPKHGCSRAFFENSAESNPSIASWADWVFEEALAGDAVALGIIAQAAGELAGTVAAVCRTIGYTHAQFPLAMAGGLVVHRESFREDVHSELKRLGLKPEPIGLVPDPVSGAVILAQRLFEEHVHV
jgi:N-acetylglucosamine kinase-like BadF-type ATPase